MKRSDRMWSTGEGNGKPRQDSCLENPMNSMKRQNDRILKRDRFMKGNEDLNHLCEPMDKISHGKDKGITQCER